MLLSPIVDEPLSDGELVDNNTTSIDMVIVNMIINVWSFSLRSKYGIALSSVNAESKSEHKYTIYPINDT